MGSSQSSQQGNRRLGTVLIFNHVNFPGRESLLRQREGSNTDVVRLRLSFQRLGLDVVDLRSDMTTEEVKDTLKYHASIANHSNDSCFIVVVLSHGEAGGKIYSKDSHYYTNDVWELLNKTNSSLHGKPKILIFQACRGDTNEAVLPIGGCIQRDSDDVPSYKLPKLPHNSEFLMAYSTVEHRTSKRHRTDGSWYIETLCQELDSLRSPVQLFELMTRVTKGVVARRHNQSGQTPVLISQLHDILIVPVPRPIQNDAPDIPDDDICNDSSFSSSDIVSDASGTISNETLAVPQTQYQIKEGRGRAVIFYDGNNYHQSAKKMNDYLKILNFNIKLVKLSPKNNLLKMLEKEQNDVTLSSASCLLICVFASLEYMTETGLERCYINIGRASYPLEYTWCPFLASKCNKLLNKPKLFVFIDFECGLEDDASKVQKEVPDNYRIPDNSVTEHSDFLLVVAFCEEFLKSLCKELRECVINKNDIHAVFTRAMKDSAEKNSKPLDRIPHLESTLRYELQFHDIQNPNEMPTQTKAPTLAFLQYLVVFIFSMLSVIKSEETKKLKSEIAKCMYKIKQLEQEKHSNKIVIENVPCHKKEDLRQIVHKICEKIKLPPPFEICETNILNVIRIENKTENHKYPPKIIVKLSSHELRDQIIKYSRINKIIGNDIETESSMRIYVNPCLSQENYNLFVYASKLLKNEQSLNFAHVWYGNDGKILARKTSESKPIIIKSKQMVDDIVKIFKKSST